MMLVMSLYVSDNISLTQQSSAPSVHLPLLIPALHGDEMRCNMLPPGLLASQWSALLRQGYEHFLAIFSPFCRRVCIEIVF